MIKKYRIVSVVFFLLVAHPAYASDFEGIGNALCRNLTNEYDAADRGFRQNLLVATSQWAMGYMTGLNIRLPEHQRRELGRFNKVTLAKKIIAKCRRTPNDVVAGVVTKMYMSAPAYRGGTS